MKRYIDPEKQQFRFYVRSVLNGYALQVLIVDRDENIPLSPQVASKMGISLPDGYRIQCCTREEAEKTLDEVADLNEWIEVDQPVG